MDKQKILEWANELIQRYHDSSESIIYEFSDNEKEDLKENEQYCDELKQEIKNLLELD